MADRRHQPPILLGIVVAVLVACSTSPSIPPTSSGGPYTPPSAPESGLSLADATVVYGAGPSSNLGVTLQPDVVVVQGGPSVIRGASADGLTWTIDANAPGARDLQPGKVMFLTSVAVGRVADIQDQGDARVVTLAPIDLTELIKDGNVSIDTDIPLDSAVYQVLPSDLPASDQPDPSASPDPFSASVPGTDTSGAHTVGDETVLTLPPIRLAAARPGEGPAGIALASTGLSLPLNTCPKVGIGDWSVEYCIKSGTGVTMNVDWTPQHGLKLGIALKLKATKHHVQSGAFISDGQMVDSGGILDGLDGIEYSMVGGVEDGAQDNQKIKIEVPVEAETPSIVVSGIPLKVYVEAKIIVETAFSGKNSTFKADGEWSLGGPIGVVAGKALAPAFNVVRSILDSERGVTLGVSGVVFAVKVKVQAGVGLYGFVAGPYVTDTWSFGLGRGSVIGAPLAECNGASIASWVGLGAGVNLNASKMDWLFGKDSFMQKYVKAKFDLDILQYQWLDKKAVEPDVPICRGN